MKEVTFNDLLDVTIQAYRDGYIKRMILEDDVLNVSFNINEEGVCGFLTSETKDESYHFQQYVKDIESLYTETFVIEGHDFPELKVGGVFTQNGYETVLNEGRIEAIMDAPLFLIKGATVTQRKGEK